MGKLSVTPIAAFSDNYIWCISSGEDAVVVDPGDAAPVIDFLKHAQLKLTAILITHHHWDHTGGVEALLAQYPNVDVCGPETSCKHITRPLADHDTIGVLGETFRVLAVPGHTLDHLAFYNEESALLFCGDTLFAGGCGRLFEGSPAQMLNSLSKLQSLPGATRVYCAHEYTASNLRFALKAEPNNATLRNRYEQVLALRERGEITLPSTIEEESATNPFLRTAQDGVRQAICLREGNDNLNQQEVFAALRSWKDNS